MTTNDDSGGVSDGILTAYLDNEVEPAARANLDRLVDTDARIRDRLAHLARGERPFRQAFDLVLAAAPRDKLDTVLAAAAAGRLPSPARRQRLGVNWALGAAAACMLVMVGGTGGFMIGQSPPAFLNRLLGWDEWQESVARQISLYSRASLAASVVDPADQRTRLARLGELLDVDLSEERIALPDLSLKRVELLQVEDRRLVQLLYDGSESGPLAFCIIAESGDEGERASRRVAGMNLVYWSDGRFGFLLVGSAPAETIQGFADIAAARFAG